MRRSEYEACLLRLAEAGICGYCGEVATTIDFDVPVLARVPLYRLFRSAGAKGLPSCRECVGLSDGMSFKTLAAKRQYIATRLREKHRKLLKIPEWSKGEIDDLGYVLKTPVVSVVNQRKRLEERLLWPRMRPKRSSLSK